MNDITTAELEEVAEWLDSLYVRLQGAEIMFATRTGNEAYRESLQSDIEQATQLGIAMDRPMEHCGCLFEALNGDEIPREFLLKARSEVNNLAIAVRQAARDLHNEGKPSDPFELFHDRMKVDHATDKDIAAAWLESRSAKERNELLQDGRDAAIQSLAKRCDNLRQKRKREAKR